MRKAYTTTEVGRMFGVDKTTVSKWIDEKKLQGFKTPGGHRRVFPEALMLCFKAYGIDVPDDVMRRLEL